MDRVCFLSDWEMQILLVLLFDQKISDFLHFRMDEARIEVDNRIRSQQGLERLFPEGFKPRGDLMEEAAFLEHLHPKVSEKDLTIDGSWILGFT
jgi:hypothetical protein